ncbi:hypothetical protein C8J57DRAFT_1522755 [Mycena rebaudengoi]|nr:hypothetical protein C8J57DRAFT_1522755 [Mycena rebaudengoi]
MLSRHDVKNQITELTGIAPLSTDRDDENVMSWYIEDEDGNTITGTRAKQIREKARTVWIQLYDEGLANHNWSDANSAIRDFYAYELAVSFPELRLCELDYKVHGIATDNYSGWRNGYFEKYGPCVVKVEPELEECAASQVVSGRKRKISERAADTVPHILKRQKSTTRSKAVPKAPAAKPVKRAETPVAESPVEPAMIPILSSPSPELSPLSVLAGAASTLAENHVPLLDRSNLTLHPDSPPPLPPADVSTSKSPTTSTTALAKNPVASTSTAVRAPAPAIKRPNARPLPRKPVPQISPSAAPSSSAATAAAAEKPNESESTSSASSVAVIAKQPNESEIVNPLNLCLLDYIDTNGKVTKEVFDEYYKNLSQKEKEGYKKRSQDTADAGQQALAAQRAAAKSGNLDTA